MNLSVLLDGSEQIHYRDPAIPIYVVSSDLTSLSDMAALCHWHEDIEILLPIKGHLSYNVNGRIIPISEGSAIWVNSRQMHYGFSADGTNCEYICICFKPDLLCASEELRRRFVLSVTANPGLDCLLLDARNPSHIPVLNLIRTIGGLSLPGQEMAALGYLHLLWNGIFDLSQPEQASAADSNIAVLKQMIAFIHAHYSERISLDQIAAAGSVCRSKCCKIFKKYMGKTPNDYLNSFRLEKGTELLRGTKAPVTEIAYACGFSSPSYFTELFTKSKGCPPLAYRKNA